MRIFSLALVGIILSIGFATASFAEISNAKNFYSYDEKMLTSGQPKQEELETAAEDGIEVVISLVSENESSYNPDEATILEKQGIKYIHIPVNWSSPKESELNAVLNAIDSAEDKKTLVHCAGNARASAMVYAHRVSKAPDTQEEEFSRLKSIWSDVVNYPLENNQTWKKFLDDNVSKN